VSKLQLTLNEFELDSIDIKCPLIINKYLNRPNHYESSVLKNVWTNHYNQPPNSILGGPHVTQFTHDFVEWTNPTRNSPKWSCNVRQWWFRVFLPKMLLTMVENFPFHFSKHLGGLS